MHNRKCHNLYAPLQLNAAAEWLRKLIFDRTQSMGCSLGALGRLVYERKKQTTLVKLTITGVKRPNLRAMIRYAEAVGLEVNLTLTVHEKTGDVVDIGKFARDGDLPGKPRHQCGEVKGMGMSAEV